MLAVEDWVLKSWIPGTISHQTDLSYENRHNEDREMRFQAVPRRH